MSTLSKQMSYHLTVPSYQQEQRRIFVVQFNVINVIEFDLLMYKKEDNNRSKSPGGAIWWVILNLVTIK